MKPIRRDAILEIISQQNIETQCQLMEELAKRGIKCTQATLSRDIKGMNLIKERDGNGVSHYAVAQSTVVEELDTKLRSIFKESVESFDFAENLLVIKTLPGLAPAACSAIDSWDLKNLVGTLAGNDTAFLAMKDHESAIALYNELQELLKD